MVQDRVADGLQRRRRVMEDLAKDEGLLDLAGGMRFARCFESVEGSANGGVVGQVHPGQPAAEEIAVLGGHARAVRGVGRRRMSGIADEGSPALRPLLGRLAVAQYPALHVAGVGGGD